MSKVFVTVGMSLDRFIVGPNRGPENPLGDGGTDIHKWLFLLESVLTHEQRRPWERNGGTTFHFVNDGIESALRQAREVAGNKDIRISGGAHAVRRYLPLPAM